MGKVIDFSKYIRKNKALPENKLHVDQNKGVISGINSKNSYTFRECIERIINSLLKINGYKNENQ